MGFFTRNTMPLDDMAKLTASVVSAELKFYADNGVWPGNEFRTRVANSWLSDTGHKASFIKLSKMMLLADRIAQSLTEGAASLPFQMRHGTDEERIEIAQDLVRMSREELIHAGLVR